MRLQKGRNMKRKISLLELAFILTREDNEFFDDFIDRMGKMADEAEENGWG